ncbi:IS110 family transposase [Micromonospora sp. 15K316]|nr:IS110 family transposase [Micromonospora sp. 15K316]
MSENQDVTVGVDTHKDMHVAAVLDQTGQVLGTRGFPTTTRGYAPRHLG